MPPPKEPEPQGLKEQKGGAFPLKQGQQELTELISQLNHLAKAVVGESPSGERLIDSGRLIPDDLERAQKLTGFAEHLDQLYKEGQKPTIEELREIQKIADATIARAIVLGIKPDDLLRENPGGLNPEKRFEEPTLPELEPFSSKEFEL